MKTLSRKAKIRGLTLVEVLVVIAVIAILAVVILPVFYDGPRRAYRVECMSNLKQIDLGFALYACDYGGKYPMQVTVQNGGTEEFIYTGYAFPHFEKLRKYMGGPEPFRVFVCPKDRTRQAATNYEALNNLNISYFLNADASSSTNNPSPSQAIFAGERDLSFNRQPVKEGLLIVTTNIDLDWTGEFHLNGGNLAFVDGHVEWSKTNELNSSIQRQPIATNRFCVP